MSPSYEGQDSDWGSRRSKGKKAQHPNNREGDDADDEDEGSESGSGRKYRKQLPVLRVSIQFDSS
jgi:hypothetical protein